MSSMSRIVACSLRGYRILSLLPLSVTRMARRPPLTPVVGHAAIPSSAARWAPAVPTNNHANGSSNNNNNNGATVDMNTMCVYSNAKAGMAGLDKDYINRVIYENSKDSAHFKNQQRKAELVAIKIAAMKKRVDALKSTTRNNDVAVRKQAAAIAELEARRDLSHTWIHVDMDMFYAAVEIRDNPSLADKPVAVGSLQMISTSNYVARRFGVRAAMPGFLAMKLCPQLVFVKHNFMKYKEVAEQARAIFRDYDPDFEAGSLDEAYLDVTNYINRHNSAAAAHHHDRAASSGDASGDVDGDRSPDITELLTPPGDDNKQSISAASSSSSTATAGHAGGGGSGTMMGTSDIIDGAMIASEIRARIFAATRLTASAGVACNRMLSKICSDMNKPNGQFNLPSRTPDIMAFMDNLGVRKVPGVGSVMERTLNELGMTKCRDLRHGELALYLGDMFSQIHCDWLLKASLGLSESQRAPPDENHLQKSMSCDRTFHEISQPADLENKCRDIARSLAADLAESNVEGRHLTLKLKNTDFETLQRSTMLPRWVHTADDIAQFALIVLHDEISKHAKKTITMDKFLKTNTPIATISAVQPTASITPSTAASLSPLKPSLPSSSSAAAASGVAKSKGDLKHNFAGKQLRLRLMGLKLGKLRFRATPATNIAGVKSVVHDRQGTRPTPATTDAEGGPSTDGMHGAVAATAVTAVAMVSTADNDDNDDEEVPDSSDERDDNDDQQPAMGHRYHGAAATTITDHKQSMISSNANDDSSTWDNTANEDPSSAAIAELMAAAPSGSKYARQNGQYHGASRAVGGPANTIGHAGNNWTKRDPALRVRPPSPLTAMIHAMNASSQVTVGPASTSSSSTMAVISSPVRITPAAVVAPKPIIASPPVSASSSFSHADLTDLTMDVSQAMPSSLVEHKRSSSPMPSMWQCPICGAPVPRDNRELNQHVDQCLGAPALASSSAKRALQFAAAPQGTKRKASSHSGTKAKTKTKSSSSSAGKSKSKSKSKSKKSKSGTSSSSSSASSTDKSSLPIGAFFR